MTSPLADFLAAKVSGNAKTLAIWYAHRTSRDPVSLTTLQHALALYPHEVEAAWIEMRRAECGWLVGMGVDAYMPDDCPVRALFHAATSLVHTTQPARRAPQ